MERAQCSPHNCSNSPPFDPLKMHVRAFSFRSLFTRDRKTKWKRTVHDHLAKEDRLNANQCKENKEEKQMQKFNMESIGRPWWYYPCLMYYIWAISMPIWRFSPKCFHLCFGIFQLLNTFWATETAACQTKEIETKIHSEICWMLKVHKSVILPMLMADFCVSSFIDCDFIF